jgi:extradiol dioxygenase family protein
MPDIDLDAVGRERARLRETYLQPAGERPASTARGLHHTALVSGDVERTVRFYLEVLGGLHRIAISVAPGQWQDAVDRLEAAGVPHEVHSEVSVYSRDPDGARLELIADPLSEMYGNQVL